MFKILIAAVCGAALASCGGDPSNAMLPSPVSPLKQAISEKGGGAHAVAIDAGAPYLAVVQQIYVSYFGRPADPAGLKFWSQQLANVGAPTTLQGVDAAYDSNAGLRNILNGFGTSAESQALYSGSTLAFVNAIYRNILGRESETAGRDFWASQIDSGAVTRARAAVSIMSGALATRATNPNSTDAITVDYKTQAASFFTASLDTESKVKAYSGLAPSALARTMMNGISSVIDESSLIGHVSVGVDTVAPTAPITPAMLTGYHRVATQLFMAYLGRPPSPGDLRQFSTLLYNLRAPSTIDSMASFYAADARFRALADFLASTAESQRLYAGSDNDYIMAIFRTMLARAPSSDETVLWSGRLSAGAVMHSQAPLSVIAEGMVRSEAHPNYFDRFVIGRKTEAATQYTAALNTDARVAAYTGIEALRGARGMLNIVTSRPTNPTIATYVEYALDGAWNIAPCTASTSPQPAVMWGAAAMIPICEKLYIDPGATKAQIEEVKQAVAYGRIRVERFYSGLRAPATDVIVCVSDGCRRYFMGGHLGGVIVFRTGPLDGASYSVPRTTIMINIEDEGDHGRAKFAHELAHAEFNARVGGNWSQIPQWFDEGQASFIGSPTCDTSILNVVPDLRTLDDPLAWHNAVYVGPKGLNIYCQAEREVGAWLAKNGTEKYHALLEGVNAGIPFYTQYGALLTQ